MTTGLLLFAHGARDPNWSLPFQAVLETVRARAPGVCVILSYLEFMSPDLIDGGHALAAAGCTRVDIVPLFLGTGGHVRKDLPLLIDALRSAHPQTTWTARTSIGEAPGVIEAIAQASLAFVLDKDPANHSSTEPE
ncbi:MAG: sirohydrochlorin chelatase [Rhizobacter sp.]